MDLVKCSLRLRRATDAALILASVCLCLVSPSWAQEAAPSQASAAARAQLDRFAERVRDLTADFEQAQFDDNGELLDEPALGQFLLLRPDRFLWRQDSPIERIFLSDGEFLWDYDVELEQATRAPLSTLETSPAMLLSGEGELGDDYRVEALSTDDGYDWIELTPADSATSDFVSAKIAFADDVPVALELVDGLGDRTHIDFLNVEVNPGLKASEFEFDAPRGVQIVVTDD
jgi:outer membrane lipoprotein carrier protein